MLLPDDMFTMSGIVTVGSQGKSVWFRKIRTDFSPQKYDVVVTLHHKPPPPCSAKAHSCHMGLGAVNFIP